MSPDNMPRSQDHNGIENAADPPDRSPFVHDGR
jgi:hypothetical protein